MLPTATTGVVTTVDSATFDDMLVDAFRSMIYLPSSMPGTIGTGLPSHGSASLRTSTWHRVVGRRLMLYHGLMAELGGAASHGGQRANDNDDDDNGANGGGDGGKRRKRKDNYIDSMIRRRYRVHSEPQHVSTPPA